MKKTDGNSHELLYTINDTSLTTALVPLTTFFIAEITIFIFMVTLFVVRGRGAVELVGKGFVLQRQGLFLLTLRLI